MENTKLVSGEIQHSSSKTRKCERLGLTNAKGPNQEIQISAETNPISSKANQSKLCEGSRSVICHTEVLNGGSGGGYPKSGPKLNSNGSGVS